MTAYELGKAAGRQSFGVSLYYALQKAESRIRANNAHVVKRQPYVRTNGATSLSSQIKIRNRLKTDPRAKRWGPLDVEELKRQRVNPAAYTSGMPDPGVRI